MSMVQTAVMIKVHILYTRKHGSHNGSLLVIYNQVHSWVEKFDLKILTYRHNREKIQKPVSVIFVFRQKFCICPNV